MYPEKTCNLLCDDCYIVNYNMYQLHMSFENGSLTLIAFVFFCFSFHISFAHTPKIE